MQIRSARRTWFLVAATTSALTLAACGGSGDKAASASNGGASTTASAPASGAGSDEAAAARSRVAPYLQMPTKINQSTALTGAPPKGTWVLITCELPQCQVLSAGALSAAKAAGVPTKLLSYKTTDATTLTSAMKQALDLKPMAVTPIGFSQAVWQNLVPQYQSAGVPITSISVGDTKVGGPVTEGAASQLDYGKGGATMADYVISSSGGAAHVLVADVPAFAVLKAYGDGFKDGMAKNCSRCKVSSLDVAPAQLASNGFVPAIVSALQRDRSITWLAATDGAFLTGISGALKAAGLNDIKIVGGSPDVNNLKALQTGEQTAWTGASEDEYGWVALDIIFRTKLGMTVPPADGGRVTAVVTKDNVGTATPSGSGLGYPKDFQQQYAKLWGL